MEAGGIYLADLNQEISVKVLVTSTADFARFANRVFVAPEVPGADGEVLDPWRVESDDTGFAVDLLRSLPADRLRKRTGRASALAIEQVRRAIVHILA